MRPLHAALLAVTIVAVAALGLLPTGYGLSNGLTDVECRSVLGGISNAHLAGGDEVSSDVAEEWLLRLGGDDGEVDPDARAAATERAQDLCDDARVGRVGWMLLIGVAGLGLSGAVAGADRRRSVDTAADGKPGGTEEPR